MRTYGELTSKLMKICKANNIATSTDCYYDSAANTNVLAIRNKETNHLIANFHMVDSKWKLNYTNYPEYFV